MTSDTFQDLFSALGAEALDRLTVGGGRHEVGTVPTESQQWCELFGKQPVAADDTLVLGFRADVSYSDATAHGRFTQTFIAWSKLQAHTVAMGGVTITCERDGECAPVPEKWISRMELDFGEMWASAKILSFRRGVGLPTRAGEGVDADSSDERLSSGSETATPTRDTSRE